MEKPQTLASKGHKYVLWFF